VQTAIAKMPSTPPTNMSACKPKNNQHINK